MAGPGGVDRDVAVRIGVEAGIEPGDVEWPVVDGDPCSALLRLGESPDPAAMLVVGSRGAGGHGGTLIGSTSLELAEHAPVPVTIVPSSYRGRELALPTATEPGLQSITGPPPPNRWHAGCSTG